MYSKFSPFFTQSYVYVLMFLIQLIGETQKKKRQTKKKIKLFDSLTVNEPATSKQLRTITGSSDSAITHL